MNDRKFNLEYNISQQQIQEIISNFPQKTQLQKVKPMNYGLSAFLTQLTVTQGSKIRELMLRIINPDREHKMARELGAIHQANHVYHIPSPQIYLKDYSRSIIPEPYYCYDYIPGFTLVETIRDLSFDHLKKIVVKIGIYLATMHRDTREQIGALLDSDTGIEFHPFEIQHSLSEVEYWGMKEDFDWVVSHGFGEKYPNLADGCFQIWADYKNTLKDYQSPIGFTHNDLNADNVIIQTRHSEILPVVIDWEMGCYGQIHYDLANTERNLLRHQVSLSPHNRKILQNVFWESYRTIRPIEPQFWQKRVVFQLVAAMDELSELDIRRKRLSQTQCNQIELNLIEELQEYLKKYY